VQQPMTSTARLVAGVIGALFAPPARLYEMNAAFGVVIVCVAFAATMEVMMATTVAMRMTPGRENFCIGIVIAFILFGFLFCFGFFCWFFVLVFRLKFFVSRLGADFAWNQGKLGSSSGSLLRREAAPMRMSRYRNASPRVPLTVRRSESNCIRRCPLTISSGRIAFLPAAISGGMTNAPFEILRCGENS